jgi:hypothetical protein
MSHFTVLVIGNDPEEQLVPFDENTRTELTLEGPVDEDEMKRFMDHYHAKHKEESPSVPIAETTFEEMYTKHGEDWNGSMWKKHEDGTWYNYSTYNPNSKWDWYALGGRWTGFFKLKEGAKGVTGSPGIMTQPGEKGWVDQALKSAIDFEAMRNHEGQKATERYEKAMEIFADLPVQLTWEGMIDPLKENGSRADIDKVRTEYWAQPRCVAWHNADMGFGSSPDTFLIPKEDYVQKARNGACGTYAVLYNGKWISKGDMLMFGMSSDKVTQDEWDTKITELINELPEDTLLSLYDLHI